MLLIRDVDFMCISETHAVASFGYGCCHVCVQSTVDSDLVLPPGGGKYFGSHDVIVRFYKASLLTKSKLVLCIS